MSETSSTLVKTLQKRGNSHALVIDKTMVEQLGIGPDALLQVTITSGCLVVRPTTVGLGRDRVEGSLRKIRSDPDYKKMLESLAQ